MEKNFNIKKIKLKSESLRKEFIKLLIKGFKYHIGGTLSCLDLLIVLFYSNFIKIESKNRDFFLLSKGHALATLNLILIDKKILSYAKLEKGYKKMIFGGQLDIFNSKFVDWNTGSLGHSLGVGIGLSLRNPKKKIWTLVGDAEFEEGSIWEALFYISEKKINNMIIIIDRNKMSASSSIHKKDIFDKKILHQLNFNILKINGHNYNNIFKCYKKCKNQKISSIIIANTIKGKGFKILENNPKYTHQTPSISILNSLIE
jgi:transketolase